MASLQACHRPRQGRPPGSTPTGVEELTDVLCGGLLKEVASSPGGRVLSAGVQPAFGVVKHRVSALQNENKVRFQIHQKLGFTDTVLAEKVA